MASVRNLGGWLRRHPGGMGGLILVLLTAAGLSAYYGNHFYRAAAHRRATLEALRRRDWAVARTHAATLLEIRPNDPSAHLLAARAARRADRLDRAEDHLVTSEQLQGETPATRLERALLETHQGQLVKTEAFLRERLAADDPDAEEILDILTTALILAYRVKDSQDLLDVWLQKNPVHVEALARRGWVAKSMGEPMTAVGYYDRVLALAPDKDVVRLALAEILIANSRVAEAQRHFETLLGQHPRNPAARLGLARCHYQNGQFDEARILLDGLLKDHPGDWKVMGERGRVALKLGQPEEAERYLRPAASLAPQDLPILSSLAQCLVQLGKTEEARTWQARADQLLADFRRADQLGDLIRDERPHDPALRWELGTILLRLGQTKDGVHWLETALEKDPAHRPSHHSLAEFYERAGRADLATPHRQALVKPAGGP